MESLDKTIDSYNQRIEEIYKDHAQFKEDILESIQRGSQRKADATSLKVGATACAAVGFLGLGYWLDRCIKEKKEKSIQDGYCR